MRDILAANRDYYIAPTGSDVGSGSSASPWATLQHAYDWIQANLDLARYTVTVHVAAGTYARLMAFGPIVGQIQPSSLTFSGTGAVVSSANSCFTGVYGAMFRAEGFKVTSSRSGFVSDGASFIELGSVEFSYCNWAHMHAVAGGRISLCGATYQVTGGGPFAQLSEGGGKIYILESVCNFPNNGVTFAADSNAEGGYFAYAGQGGLIDYTGTSFAGSSNTVVGKKFHVGSNGVISVNGNSLQCLPGLTPGDPLSTGGQYV